MAELPTGTVTFLFTDVEGSTRLWEQHTHAMEAALKRHDALAVEVIRNHGGAVVKHRGEGDSLFAVFDRASCAVVAACSLQQQLFREPWPTPKPVRVRMALHAGEADVREGDYYGPALNRCARLRAAAHGGQVLLSGVAQALAQETSLPEVSLRDLGVYQLRDLARPERIFQALASDLPGEFPPLRWAKKLPEGPPAVSDPESADLDSLRSALTAIQNGHLSFHLPVHRSGPAREIALTLNAKLDVLDDLTGQIRMTLRGIAHAGRWGDQVHEPGALGRWKELVEALNVVSHTLAEQLGDVGRVMTALENGDFTQRVTVKAAGEMEELKETLNRSIDRLEAVAHEHLRITQEIGARGIFGGQGRVPGLVGNWKDLLDSLNQMGGSLTGQVRNIHSVVDCLVRGDFTRKVSVDAPGETGQLKESLNRLVDLLDLFAAEISRVACGDHEEPPEERAEHPSLSGVWREMFDNLNAIAALPPP